MKNNHTRAFLLLTMLILGVFTVQGQGSLLRKIQNRAEDKIVDGIFKDSKKETETESIKTQTETEASSPNRNRKGAGLSKDVPDVIQSIKDSESSMNDQNYSEAKSALRKALWGVELEIGQNVLKSLPSEVESLKADQSQDQVTSTGIGFVGLIIERVYIGKDDLELTATIGNDASILGLSGALMASGMYVNSTEETDSKQIRYKDHQAVIQYDENDGYSISVPFGQSSIFLVKGTNFEDESSFMAAANSFDFDNIKKELGVQ